MGKVVVMIEEGDDIVVITWDRAVATLEAPTRSTSGQVRFTVEGFALITASSQRAAPTASAMLKNGGDPVKSGL